MANRIFDPVRAAGKEHILVEGSFTSTGTGSGNQPTTLSKYFTVARTGTGVYTITLNDSYSSLISVSAIVKQATATLHSVTLGANDVVSAKTVVLSLVNGSGAFDLPSADMVLFKLTLKNSTVY